MKNIILLMERLQCSSECFKSTRTKSRPRYSTGPLQQYSTGTTGENRCVEVAKTEGMNLWNEEKRQIWSIHFTAGSSFRTGSIRFTIRVSIRPSRLLRNNSSFGQKFKVLPAIDWKSTSIVASWWKILGRRCYQSRRCMERRFTKVEIPGKFNDKIETSTSW